ncbi:MAG: hypothetical protein IPN39_17995 [Chitinophagaceae bacterium]|nr:hypothetical protein [Chitinophagaceae bacterium]
MPKLKAFIAGADIFRFGGLNREEAMALAKGQDTFAQIENSSKPVSCCKWLCIRWWLELAMSCHFRVAAENAKFGRPEVNLG